MTEHSKRINKQAEEYIMQKYGLSRKEVRNVMDLYTKYVYDKMNELSFDKPIKDQPNCVNITGMGYLRARRGVLVLENMEDGTVKKKWHNQVREWFKYMLTSPLVLHSIEKLKQHRK